MKDFLVEYGDKIGGRKLKASTDSQFHNPKQDSFGGLFC
jgi:hypothetical protein